MKKLKIIYSISLWAALALAGCSKEDGIDDDLSFLNTAASADVNKIFDISNDNTGNVRITPLGTGVSSFTVKYGHGTGAGASATVMPGSSAIHVYPEGTYTVVIDSKDIAGRVTSATYPLALTYRSPENIEVTIGADARIKATAKYANSFVVYYGDVVNETGTALSIGGELPAHIYPAGGPYVLKVIANSGGTAKTTYTKTLFGFPIDFENAAVEYFFGTFGDVVFTKVANPSATGLNTSAMVGKYVKPTGVPSWSGTYSPLNIPANLAHGKKVKVLVYNPSPANIGKNLNIELEAAIAASNAPANGVAVLRAPITTSGAWEELVFDFSTIAAVPATSRFGQLVLRFNDSAEGLNETIYLDNFRITN